jgi:ribosomal protein S18 acetylase RimI-like enzyme
MITVLRPYRGKGLAKALVTQSMLMLREMGMEYANLGVDTENLSGAIRLYEGLGYETIKTYTIYGKDLEVSR